MRTSSTKSDLVARELRDAILSGTLQPGMCLPTWTMMERQYSVGRPTLTRALAVLKRDGFIRATRSRGTFVSDRPPHLVRFGLVFSSHPSEVFERTLGWNRYWDLLATMSSVVGAEFECELPIFYNVGCGGSEDESRLEHELQHGRLGGLILVGNEQLMSLPILHSCQIPVIAIHNRPDEVAWPCVCVDYQSFVERSLEAMASRGRKRIAVITNRFVPFFPVDHSADGSSAGGSSRSPWQAYGRRFADEMARRGFACKPHWHVMSGPTAASAIVRLLFDQEPGQAPDGLILADDNLVEEALAGVIAAGITVPEHLTIITHCNWPSPPPAVLSVIGLGFDARDVLRQAIDMLHQLQKKHHEPSTQYVPARFESTDEAISNTEYAG